MQTKTKIQVKKNYYSKMKRNKSTSLLEEFTFVIRVLSQMNHFSDSYFLAMKKSKDLTSLTANTNRY